MQKSEHDRNHARAVNAYRRGNDYRWVACLAASRIVGRYAPGATAALASDLCVGVDQVENLAKAGIMYRRLRPMSRDVSEIRRVLSPSHFATMGDMVIKYDIPLPEALAQLRTAAENGASVRTMAKYVSEENGGGLTWYTRWQRANVLLDMVAHDEAADNEYRRLAGQWQDLVRRALP